MSHLDSLLVGQNHKGVLVVFLHRYKLIGPWHNEKAADTAIECTCRECYFHTVGAVIVLHCTWKYCNELCRLASLTSTLSTKQVERASALCVCVYMCATASAHIALC